jgi:hypothetical protein
MHASKETHRFQPVWWTVQHTVVWEQRSPSLRRDFERRRAARERARLAAQGPDDSVIQHHPRTPRNVDIERAHLVGDNDWEVGSAWEQIEAGLRYGVGARLEYPDHDPWSDELEALLRKEWEKHNDPSNWAKVRRAVRHGFEYAAKDPS